MGPGTLYGSLDPMIEAGFVTKGNTRDPRRICYELTAPDRQRGGCKPSGYRAVP